MVLVIVSDWDCALKRTIVFLFRTDSSYGIVGPFISDVHTSWKTEKQTKR
jgi:hypothetical protein